MCFVIFSYTSIIRICVVMLFFIKCVICNTYLITGDDEIYSLLIFRSLCLLLIFFHYMYFNFYSFFYSFFYPICFFPIKNKFLFQTRDDVAQDENNPWGWIISTLIGMYNVFYFDIICNSYHMFMY